LAVFLAAAGILSVGCGRAPSTGPTEVGTISVNVKSELVNYHSVGIWWTTTIDSTTASQYSYRLYIWDKDTTRSENVPESNYGDLSYLSAGADQLIPVTGLGPDTTYYVWIAAYAASPQFTIITESPRVQFTTCSTPYRSIARAPRRLSGHRAAAIGNLVYVVWPDQFFERFDPAASSGAGEWAGLGQVPHAHTGFGLAVQHGKLYVIGGEGQSDIDVYDPASGLWSSKAPIPAGTSVRCAVTLRDTIFTFASTDQLDPNRAWNEYPTSRAAAAYYPETGSWGARSNRPGSGTVMGPVVPFQGKLYLFGGYSVGLRDYNFIYATFWDSVYVYDPDADRWSGIDIMPDDPVGFQAFAYGGKMYCAGGLLERRLRTVETWTVPPSFTYTGTADSWHLRTLLGAPLDFGHAAAVASTDTAVYFVNGGNRWPGTLGAYAPDKDACGVDIVVWEDLIPYGIPFTTASSRAAPRPASITIGPPRHR